MNILKFKLVVLGLVILTACSESPHQVNIKKVDHLKVRLDSAAAVYDNIDTNGYHMLNKKYKLNMAFVQQKLKEKGDTLSREIALLMADYRDLRKPYSQFKSKYEQAGKELDFSENQLITLKHDLVNNKMDTVIANHMILNEVNATESIISTIDHLNIMNRNVRKKTVVMEPKIDSLITVLKQY